MDKKSFDKSTYILSQYIDKDTRVMDLGCGDSSYTEWMKSKGIGSLIPLSPDDLEHIDRENPFVAYNNFINDPRMLPEKDGKADVILLMGPLYHMQNRAARQKTLKEVKRLLSSNGKIITLGNSKPDEATPKKHCTTAGREKKELEKAGFTVDRIKNIFSGINKQEKVVKMQKADYFVAVATPQPEPESEKNKDATTAKTLTVAGAAASVVRKNIDEDPIFNSNSPEPAGQSGKPVKSGDEKPLQNNSGDQPPVSDKTMTEPYKNSKEIILSTPYEQYAEVMPSIDKQLVVREDKDEIVRRYLELAELREVHPSIDKSLQLRIPKINPKYAKQKSRKKGTGNLIKFPVPGK